MITLNSSIFRTDKRTHIFGGRVFGRKRRFAQIYIYITLSVLAYISLIIHYSAICIKLMGREEEKNLAEEGQKEG